MKLSYSLHCHAPCYDTNPPAMPSRTGDVCGGGMKLFYPLHCHVLPLQQCHQELGVGVRW